MNNIELAHTALRHVVGTDFPCQLYASEGGKCAGGWDGSDDLFIPACKLLYLIIGNNTELLPKGRKVKKYDSEADISDLAIRLAWPDGKTEETEYWSHWGECPALDNYVNAWNVILDEIDEGKLTSKNIKSVYQYFNEREYDEWTLQEWRDINTDK